MKALIVYFKKRDEFHKALSYLHERSLGGQQLGSGMMIASKNIVDCLNNGGFKFGIAKSTGEVYEKEPNLIKDYADQVRKHYKSLKLLH